MKTYIGLVSIIITFLVFLFADSKISLDYGAYFYFLNKLPSFTVNEITFNFFNNFPYIVDDTLPVGRSNWEFGFVFLAYPLTIIFGPKTTYALIASLSIALKFFAFNRLNINLIMIICLLVVSITLFEANALRAGVALSIYLFGLSFHKVNHKKTIIYSVIACFFHISFFIFIALHLFGYLLYKTKYKSTLLFLTIFFSVFVLINLSEVVLFVMDFFGTNLIAEKLLTYFTISEILLLNQASGIGILSLIFLFIAIISIINLLLFHQKESTIVFGLVLSGLGFAINTFSGNFYILADRLTQPLLFSTIIVFYASTISTRLKRPIDYKKIDLYFVARDMTLSLMYVSIIYFTYSLLYIYPQSNFFSIFTGHNDLYVPPAF